MRGQTPSTCTGMGALCWRESSRVQEEPSQTFWVPLEVRCIEPGVYALPLPKRMVVLDFDHCDRWCCLAWLLSMEDSPGCVALVDAATSTVTAFSTPEVAGAEEGVLCMTGCKKWETVVRSGSRILGTSFPHLLAQEVDVRKTIYLDAKTKKRWEVSESVREFAEAWEGNAKKIYPPFALAKSLLRRATTNVVTEDSSLLWKITTPRVWKGLDLPVETVRWPVPFSWTRLGGVLWASEGRWVSRVSQDQIEQRFVGEIVDPEVGGMEDFRGRVWSIRGGHLIRREPVFYAGVDSYVSTG